MSALVDTPAPYPNHNLTPYPNHNLTPVRTSLTIHTRSLKHLCNNYEKHKNIKIINYEKHKNISRPDCAYKLQFFSRSTSHGVPPFLISMPHEWFSSACAYAQLPALGREKRYMRRDFALTTFPFYFCR